MEKKTIGQKVKGHFKKHKDKYIVGGVCITAGVVIGVVVSKGGRSESDDVITNVKGVFIKSPVTTNVHLERRGHPGNVIRCNETGEIFASQRRAAEAMGVSRMALNNQLSGKVDSVKGYTFEKLGEAS